MAEKKTTTKETATKKAATTKKACATKKTCATKKAATTLYITAENVGFRAGDVYQALANAEGALSVKEIAKVAKISEEEVLLGAGWLMKEGKINGDCDTISLA